MRQVAGRSRTSDIDSRTCRQQREDVFQRCISNRSMFNATSHSTTKYGVRPRLCVDACQPMAIGRSLTTMLSSHSSNAFWHRSRLTSQRNRSCTTQFDMSRHCRVTNTFRSGRFHTLPTTSVRRINDKRTTTGHVRSMTSSSACQLDNKHHNVNATSQVRSTIPDDIPTHVNEQHKNIQQPSNANQRQGTNIVRV
jgi:hypothetical protein